MNLRRYNWIKISSFGVYILIKKLFALLALVFFGSVFANPSQDVYSAMAPVENQSEQQRLLVLPNALRGVINNLIAQGIITSDTADIDDLYAQASRYVESFSYISDVEQSADPESDSSKALMINVHFDRDALTKFFMQHHMMQMYHFNLQISGIHSKKDLDAMMSYLNQLNSVQSLIIDEVNGDIVTLSLASLRDKSVWLQIMATDQRLLLQDADVQEAALSHFQWQN